MVATFPSCHRVFPWPLRLLCLPLCKRPAICSHSRAGAAHWPVRQFDDKGHPVNARLRFRWGLCWPRRNKIKPSARCVRSHLRASLRSCFKALLREASCEDPPPGRTVVLGAILQAGRPWPRRLAQERRPDPGWERKHMGRQADVSAAHTGSPACSLGSARSSWLTVRQVGCLGSLVVAKETGVP